MEGAKPQKEHEFLQRIVGDWEMVSSSMHQGCGPGSDQSFTETFRSVDGLWFIGEGNGSEMTTIITLGFDPAKGEFVGTWIGSGMTYLWIYKGWLEPDGKTLVLEAEGPRMDGAEGTGIYHDIITLHDDNRRTFSGSMQQPDGSFKQFMSSEFRRRA